jgi:beta-alanine degradation protein BauB
MMRAPLLISILFVSTTACGPKKTAPANPEPMPEPEPTAAAPAPAPAPEPAPAPPPPPPKPTDPVLVGPDIYKMVLDDDHARVLEVTFKAGAEIGMHKHPDHFAYVLTPGKLTITGEDGKAQDFDLKAGAGMFLPAQSHSAKNPGTTEVKAVVFELKMAGTAAPKGTDPAKAGPKIYKKVFENEKVRAFEVTFAKGAKIAKHSHPDHIAYALTDGKLKITPETGEPQEAELKMGQALYLPAQVHAAQNTGGKPLKVLVLELKPAGGAAEPAAAPAPAPKK